MVSSPKTMALLTIAVMLALHVPNTAVQRDTRSWYQAYDEGRLAVGKNDAAAISSLEAAKRAGPKPARNVSTYGDNFITFNPDYYLGLAFLNLKRWGDAEAAFRRVQQAQLIGPKDKEYSALTAQLSKASFELAMNTAEQALAAGQFDQALKAVLQAPSTSDRADTQRAKNLALKIEAAKTPAKNRTPTPVNPTPSPSTPAPSPTPTITPRPTVAPSPLSPVSAIEQRGMALFFKGDYAGALAQLRAVSGGPTPTARAYFYIACAEAGLVLTGQADAQMLQEAKTLYANANGNSGEFSADRRFISPGILTLLRGKQ